jgi:hypothetical protein
MFLKRYDFKRVRGWGSVNDMRAKELRGKAEEEGREKVFGLKDVTRHFS